MTIIENISLVQRILSSVKQDAENLGAAGTSIRAKMEILEGELSIFRQLYEEIAEPQAEEMPPAADFMGMNPPVGDVIDVENPVVAE